MNDNNIRDFYKEVEECLDGEYKIILEPKRNLKEEWIEYDQVKWEMEDGIKDLVDNLLKEKSMSIEDKILEVYKYIDYSKKKLCFYVENEYYWDSRKMLKQKTTEEYACI